MSNWLLLKEAKLYGPVVLLALVVGATITGATTAAGAGAGVCACTGACNDEFIDGIKKLWTFLEIDKVDSNTIIIKIKSSFFLSEKYICIKLYKHQWLRN